MKYKHIKAKGKKKTCLFKSSWEFDFAKHLDSNNKVIDWGYEEIEIPYVSPITDEETTYLPDFWVVWIDDEDVKHKDIIEIKPACETIEREALTDQNNIRLITNIAKWKAAKELLDNEHLNFKIITEDQLYKYTYGKRTY